ncbi:MAG: hypothetical protein PF487_07155 [Bacteroidales bacterium]|jgi:hypothetical protein|nr:hypothetical protein [Bacteroidales bacterium]
MAKYYKALYFKIKKFYKTSSGDKILDIILGLANYGEIDAVFGAAGATILSKVLYLSGLALLRK